MISTVIVNWNSGPLLRRCVRSLLEHGRDAEIVIVDNASEDGGLDFLTASDAPLQVIRNRRNLGFAAAANAGWRASRGGLVLFLNPDTECLPGGLPGLSQTLEQDDSVWAAGGLLLDASWGYKLAWIPGVVLVYHAFSFLVWTANQRKAGVQLSTGNPAFRAIWATANLVTGLLAVALAWQMS